ncbi:MAG: hypothetical protein GX491_09550 [Chloroflexi bacterium]|nr:hypothetical protein [Chloroflexota bacterium]
MKFWSRLWLAFVLVTMLFALPGSSMRGLADSARQADEARQKAQELLAKLTPEERIGQLFLVTFQGASFDETSQIYDLITNHHIGGVVLMRSNDNFVGPENTLERASQLTRELQKSEWDASRFTIVDPTSGSPFSPQYIPLLIGISQEGDAFLNNQIINGMANLPSLMSLGATWNPSLAEQVGQVLGSELSSLGFNLLLGPSLDVLDNVPQLGTGEDLGVRSFGGDPYWVGKLGQAYISGLHSGSNNRLMVVAKHFPGRGSSDRSSDEEISTVRKSFEELKQVELAPFYAVTINSPMPSMMTDGLLVSHIRYQGFQGNIRATTRPVSSDASALEQILLLFSDWRAGGGLLISDNLGSQAIRRFYDPSGNAFDAHTAINVAREAFFAGNDLLFVDNFVSINDPDAYSTILRTLDNFAQKYREDDAFALRVDASVERILTMKYRLYPDFQFEDVVSSETGAGTEGSESETAQRVTYEVAQQALTLISPDLAELTNVLPRPPEPRDRILFLTDVRYGRQCLNCSDQVIMQVDALQNAVLRLYGPRAGGQISQGLMKSYAFSDLNNYLNGAFRDDEPPPIEDDLQMADWVVVSMLKPDPDDPNTMAFHRLLNERPDLLRDKKIIVFAFDAPYYLDATDISKLTAYYGLFSKGPSFVDVAARTLFQEQVTITGSLPVSVPGVGYDLIAATSPDPTQVIPLFFENPLAEQTLSPAQGPTPAPTFKIGDIISLYTGVIYDHNGNQVPDGTPVSFLFTTLSGSAGDMVANRAVIDTITVDGIARATQRIQGAGLLEIQATTGQGARSNLLRIQLTTGISGGVTQIAPTEMPTHTPEPTFTQTPTSTPTATPTPVPVAYVRISDWVFVLVLILAGAAGVSWFGIRQAIARWGLRWALCGIIGGLLAYNYLALKLPGSEDLVRDAGTPGILVVTFVGVLLGWSVGALWRQLTLPPGARFSGERPVSDPRSPTGTGPKSQSG